MELPPQGLPKRSFSYWRVALITVVLGSICALAIRGVANCIVEDSKRKSEQAMLDWFELTIPSPRGLAARFTDANDDLIADAATDAARRRSPDELIFTYVGGPMAEEELSDWTDFIAHPSCVTGKSVKTAVFGTIGEQLAALEKGTLHVTGFNTGAVPTAVASSGFVPICTFGGDDGSFGIKMQLIVRADSSIQKLEDLKGHTVTFTSRDSNSGCKAALVLLQDHDMLPQRDYLWQFSGGHEESIARIVAGEYQVAPVASDLLQRAIGTGVVKPEQIRIIYESERFPPATLGYAHDLTDELAASIRKAFFEFECRGTSLQKRLDDSGNAKFVPLSYKQD